MAEQQVEPTSGYVRVGAAVPRLHVADCERNVTELVSLLRLANQQGVEVLVFPELALTGYTCADLFHQPVLQQGALDSLEKLRLASETEFSGLFVVGLPLVLDSQLFNCAAVVQSGKVLGVVPKMYLPNYGEFYEGRWFAEATRARSREIQLGTDTVPFGMDLLFEATNRPGLVVGVEICEDLWMPIPPSSYHALAGATLILNPSASNEVIGKAGYRRLLVQGQSGRCLAGYVYASCGRGESTTDVVFGGHCLIAENSTLLNESQSYEKTPTLVNADVDLERLCRDRLRTNTFGVCGEATQLPQYRKIPFEATGSEYPPKLLRRIDAHPFVPQDEADLRARCEEIFQTQVCALASRLEHIGQPPVTIGVSGGLDSTLALLVVCKTMDSLGVDRSRIKALTMPGFGTTDLTRTNAWTLMKELGVSTRLVDIRPLCLQQMRDLGHSPFGVCLDGLDPDEATQRLRQVPPDQRHDLVFENVQARTRTSLLMNSGFVIGTGDLSELALGWCTYNGDHLSMYNPNTSIPKTLVRFLVRWAAMNEFDGLVRQTLLDVVATEITPELLPLNEDGTIHQKTEDTLGPYELHDFFLYHFLRHGEPPSKILYLAEQATFDETYTSQDLRRWLEVFLRRFFASQYKRSCVPDGPKVGTLSLSPRGDWRMPSDAQVALWLRELTQAHTPSLPQSVARMPAA